MRRAVASLALCALSLATIAVPAVTASAASGTSWQGQVKKACGAALSRVGNVPDTTAFESSSDPAFSDLSAADLQFAATFFKVVGTSYAALAKRLDGITPSKKATKPFVRFVALVDASSVALKKLGQKLENRAPGDTTDNLRPAVDAAEGGAQLAKSAARKLDLACPVLDLSSLTNSGVSGQSTCYLGSKPSDLKETSCDDPHDVELYFSPDNAFGADTPYPGDNDESGIAVDLCKTEFEKFVGIPVDQSAVYDFNYDYPDAKEWAAGDRWLDCYVRAIDDTQLTGTAKGAAQ
jgi:hypothetical protein